MVIYKVVLLNENFDIDTSFNCGNGIFVLNITEE